MAPIEIEPRTAHSWQIAKNSRNSFVDLQSQKDIKETDQTRNLFSLNTEMLYFD